MIPEGEHAMATLPFEGPGRHHADMMPALPQAANDDVPRARRWHQPGPPCAASVEATTDFLHEMWRACEPAVGTECHVDTATRGHRARSRDVHERSADVLVNGPRSANAAGFTTTRRRRLGEPVIEIDHMRVVPDLFVPPSRPEAERFNEVLVLRRETCSFSRRRTDIRSAPGHLAITRHALERVHERSLIDGGDLRTTVLDQICDADRALAFAFSAGVHLGCNRLDHRAATAIPFCDGLLLVQNRVVALRKACNPSEWQEITKGGRFCHRVAINPHTTVEIPDAYGHEMVGYVIPVAATYVAGDMMRISQQGYRDWFLRMLDRHRDEMDDIAADTASCVQQHMTRAAVARSGPMVPDIGRRMLSDIVVQRHQQPLLMSIGWTRFEHPSRWP